ncbi:MAG: hypothetical protein C0483_14165 [Pirellula sp.]|nr:hypothetical protein [Pirellula sp.]
MTPFFPKHNVSNTMTGIQVFFAAVGLITPFVSVMAAHQVAQARERKQQLLNLLVKTSQDIREYVVNSTDLKVCQRANSLAYDQMNASSSMTPDTIKSRIERYGKTLADLQTKMVVFGNAHAKLMGDKLALDLLLGGRAAPIQSKIRDLVSIGDTAESHVSDLPSIHSKMSEMVDMVDNEITELWKSIRGFNAVDWSE